MRSILDLKTSDCRWPSTSSTGCTVFACADPAQPGRPYCGPHCAIAFRRPEPAERLAAPAPARPTAARRRTAA